MLIYESIKYICIIIIAIALAFFVISYVILVLMVVTKILWLLLYLSFLISTYQFIMTINLSQFHNQFITISPSISHHITTYSSPFQHQFITISSSAPPPHHRTIINLVFTFKSCYYIGISSNTNVMFEYLYIFIHEINTNKLRTANSLLQLKS